MPPLIILDRDGVINVDSHEYIKSPDEWIPLPGSIEAIALLSCARFKIVIATNQSGVNRGLFSLQILESIHKKMLTAIKKAGGEIAKIYFCPHRPDENCQCRKPQTGLFLQIQRDFKVKSDKMIYIGDSITDYDVAQNIGCTFCLVRTGKGSVTEPTLRLSSDTNIFDNLLSCSLWLRSTYK